jgi:hypothetical protein
MLWRWQLKDFSKKEKNKILFIFRYLNQSKMKKSIILTMFFFLWISMVAQIPQSFRYQAVARDASGNVLANKSVSFRISILSGSISGIVVYSETHPAKTTNAFGLVELEIGKGTVVSGGFASIGWGNNTFFVKVEMDPAGGIAYQTMGTSQLLSVPYALQAKSVESITTDVTLAGSGSVSSPLKIAPQSATSGQVLKYTGATWSPANDISRGLILPYKDSISVPDKATVLRISCIGNTWSSAITGISKSDNGTGVIGEGAFGVFGNSTVAGGTGVRGSNASATGSGYGLSGVASSPQSGGVWAVGGLYGVQAVAESSSGYGIWGSASSTSGTTYGIYGKVSSSAGFSGYFKGGKFYVSGRIGIGTETPSAGLHLKGAGFPESFMFLEADAAQDAGFRLYEGGVAKWHIFNSSGAGGFQIYNNAGQTAIFCKQTNSLVGINTTDPTQTLDVNGVARIRGMMTGVISTPVYRTSDGTLITGASDIRLKENIEYLQNSLEKVMQLNGVTFTWKADPNKKRSIGFIAQEFEKVIPELVFTNESDGFKGINYAEVTAVLAEAIKELKAENDRLKAENELVISRIERLEKLVEKSALK